MAEMVVESLATVAVEEQQKALGNSQQLNGGTLHPDWELEKGVVVEEEDDYTNFVLVRKREEVGEVATLYLVPKMFPDESGR